ncbi:Biotin carboxyl carrier protein of acetyl-CoA carboxylase [Candidatus Ecksteinia adelgidicola]|nr:Biotin carboxyl carrier protein of acetyl-CoA carboxylase [Candidatus Ecksteinia adelgidicola]
MDIHKIKKLIKLVEMSDISELKISEGKDSIYISRIKPIPTYLSIEKECELSTEKKTVFSKKTNNILPSESITGHIIRSPIVGTFYKKLSPNEKDLITIGKNIKIGDVVCFIEAMKMMNQIETDQAGTIKAILVENGQPVEYNEPLVIIE